MDTVQNSVGPKAPRTLFHTIHLLHCHINHRGPCLLVPSWFQQWTVKWKIHRGLWTCCVKIWGDICLAQHQPLQIHHFTFYLWTKWGQGWECANPSHCVRGQDQVKTHHCRTTSASDSNGIEGVWCRPGNSISSCALQQGVNMDLLCNLHISWFQPWEVTIQH